MVKYAIEQGVEIENGKILKLDGSVFSYGDNVIAPLKISKKDWKRNNFTQNDYQDLLYKIKEGLQKIFDNFGIVQKKEETYVSQDYCQFLKEVYWKGTKLPSGLKQALSIYPA